MTTPDTMPALAKGGQGWPSPVTEPSGPHLGGHQGRAEAGHDPDDVIGQVAGDAQAVERRGEMDGGPVEIGIADAQATVCLGKVRSPVALGTAEGLAKDRDDVRAVLGGHAAGEEPAEHRIVEEPPVEALDGDLPSFAEFLDFIGLPEVRAAEQRYAATDATEIPGG